MVSHRRVHRSTCALETSRFLLEQCSECHIALRWRLDLLFLLLRFWLLLLCPSHIQLLHQSIHLVHHHGHLLRPVWHLSHLRSVLSHEGHHLLELGHLLRLGWVLGSRGLGHLREGRRCESGLLRHGRHLLRHRLLWHRLLWNRLLRWYVFLLGRCEGFGEGVDWFLGARRLWLRWLLLW